jgi:hypothetical protein
MKLAWTWNPNENDNGHETENDDGHENGKDN